MSTALAVEKCPGHLQWSAFGATYPDTVCSGALTWTPGTDPGPGVLCDAADDLRPKEVPCPFCDPEGFLAWNWSEGMIALWSTDLTPVPAAAAIHFHDGPALWWTATHPERGEERILIRSLVDDEDLAA